MADPALHPASGRRRRPQHRERRHRSRAPISAPLRRCTSGCCPRCRLRFHRQQAAFNASLHRADHPLRQRGGSRCKGALLLLHAGALPSSTAWRCPRFYAAYRHFSTLLPLQLEFSLNTALDSGDFLLYDNHRMLHARTAFTGNDRWLRGVYVDREQVLQGLRDRVKAGNTWE